MPQMNMPRRRTIIKKKKHLKENLHDGELTELKAKTSTKYVKEAIKQTQTGKFPGHSGITYESWKSWKEPKKNSKEKKDKKTHKHIINFISILSSMT